MVHCVNRVIKVVFRPASEGFSLRRQDMQHGGHGAQMMQHLRKGGGALCIQIDFMRTFQANAKCNNINNV